VDYASRSIVHITRQEASLGRIFHIWNVDARPTTWTYEWIRSFGYEFTMVPFEVALERAMKVDTTHPLYPLLPVLFLYYSGDAGLPMSWEDHLAVKPKTECTNSLAMLEPAGIICPPMSEKWMHDSLSFLIERGELTPPEVMQAVGA
jgi:myxalamid-type nonribosomal peptide synthetase MxaA